MQRATNVGRTSFTVRIPHLSAAGRAKRDSSPAEVPKEGKSSLALNVKFAQRVLPVVPLVLSRSAQQASLPPPAVTLVFSATRTTCTPMQVLVPVRRARSVLLRRAAQAAKVTRRALNVLLEAFVVMVPV